ncbi:(2Fe-2S) ferredoxin domain-containing protein [Kallotenue papyrolyticum]|uniref:(2Fe-2S) ferredoxin domain-containing protein n=1 Tax=Kallotenue papyrolyticum TaxID=1325125 RepID=UPI000478553D|nr:(2Fe-2S) ferredoxin domain-containing protein [Kallotenue papyrolyticum]
MQSGTKRIYVCHGPTCVRQVRPVWQALLDEIRLCRLADRCELIVSGCQGRCEDGPNINVYPNLTKYAHVTPEQGREIVRRHIAQDQPVTACLYHEAW